MLVWDRSLPVCSHVRINVGINEYIQYYVHKCMNACVCVCMYVCIHAHIEGCIHILHARLSFTGVYESDASGSS